MIDWLAHRELLLFAAVSFVALLVELRRAAGVQRLGTLVHWYRGALWLLWVAVALFVFVLPKDEVRDEAEMSDEAGDEVALSELPPPVLEMAEPSVLLDLFETPATSASTAALDGVKTRYEQAFIGYYVLHHCGKEMAAVYPALLERLREELTAYQEQNPDVALDVAAMIHAVVGAAQGSYQAMYAQTDCADEQVMRLSEQFAPWMQAAEPVIAPGAEPAVVDAPLPESR